MENNYITIEEGIYNGVAYKLNNLSFEEKDGHDYLKFDYETKGLEEGNEADFEQYLGEFLLNILSEAVENDKIKNDGNPV